MDNPLWQKVYSDSRLYKKKLLNVFSKTNLIEDQIVVNALWDVIKESDRKDEFLLPKKQLATRKKTNPVHVKLAREQRPAVQAQPIQKRNASPLMRRSARKKRKTKPKKKIRKTPIVLQPTGKNILMRGMLQAEKELSLRMVFGPYLEMSGEKDPIGKRIELLCRMPGKKKIDQTMGAEEIRCLARQRGYGSLIYRKHKEKRPKHDLIKQIAMAASSNARKQARDWIENDSTLLSWNDPSPIATFVIPTKQDEKNWKETFDILSRMSHSTTLEAHFIKCALNVYIAQYYAKKASIGEKQEHIYETLGDWLGGKGETTLTRKRNRGRLILRYPFLAYQTEIFQKCKEVLSAKQIGDLLKQDNELKFLSAKLLREFEIVLFPSNFIK